MPGSTTSYRPSALIEIDDDQKHEFLVEAYCLNFDRENPGPDDRFTFDAVDAGALAVLDAVAVKSRTPTVIQAALWLWQGVSEDEIRKRFSLTAEEVAAALMAVQTARRDGIVPEMRSTVEQQAATTLSVSGFLWQGPAANGATLGSDGEFTVSVRNNTTSTIRRPLVLVVFYDKQGSVIDSVEVMSFDEIAPGLAKRVNGRADPSVKRMTTAQAADNPFLYADQPSTRIEYRVLRFEFVR